MKKQLISFLLLSLVILPSYSQKKNDNNQSKITLGYSFTPVVELKATSVKNQARTSTCWSFATTSFFESELLRLGKGEFDLSEMWIVRHNYIDRLKDNFEKNGKGNLGQGGLSHDWMIEYTKHGMVPDEVYSGLNYSMKNHSHGELNSFLNAVAKVPLDRKNESDQYWTIVNEVLDTYLGEVPDHFTYKGVGYTPGSFAENLGLSVSDYVEITSFTHFPFYTTGPVPVPDNWRNVNMYNVPLDELIQIMDHALKNGFTVAWDGDVSERSFSHSKGVAIIPEVENVNSYSEADKKKYGAMTKEERIAEAYRFSQPFPEMSISQDLRQKGYEDESTTDDHLMHVTGIVNDQNGKKYYITKNSYGSESNKTGGYLNMSENYVRAKTIFILVHKDAVPDGIRKKLGI